MRMLNNDLDVAFENVTIYLNIGEIAEMLGALESLLKNGKIGDHHHINDTEYAHEITLVMYDENDLHEFEQRSRKLIQENV